ncbi:hypothetical protein CWI44_09760, partial [Neisseria meningitidis]|uniref:hypothetical protein n=1 Tax=Neisseria meningitidis TaxID=487 RepID=UPI000CC02124
TLCWNAGKVLKPADWLALTYRTSAGLRLPSFAEMYGWRAGGPSEAVKNDGGKSVEAEAGLALKGDFGHLADTLFKNAFRDLVV